MARRKIRVKGVDAVASLLIAVLAGLWAADAGMRPTGATVVDVVLVFAAITAVVWLAASAHWWMSVVYAAAGTAFAPSWWLVAIGVAAVAGGLGIGLAKRSLPWSRAVVAGLAVQVVCRLGNIGHLGVSAAIGLVLSVALFVAGLVRRSRRERRIVVTVLGGVLLAGFLAVAGFAIGGASAKPNLQNGERIARQGISQLRNGDFEGAKATFARARTAFVDASDAIGRPWAQPARLVPVLAQNRRALADLTDGAERSIGDIVDALGKVNLDTLKLVNGKLDLDAVRNLDAPLQELRGTLDSLDRTVSSVQANQWVIGAVRSKLQSLHTDLVTQRGRLDDALAVVRQAPAMLGGDGTRVYFVAFVSPAEARGSVGLMGNWAELTVENGKLSMSRFGQHETLDVVPNATTRTIAGSAEWTKNWAPYGVLDHGTTTKFAWANITVSPNFPDTASAMAQLYPQSGGREVDGVLAMDVDTLATLLNITGPIQVDGLDHPLTAANASEFLLRTQYATIDRTDRKDLLATFAEATVNKLFQSSLPSPPKLANLLAPLTAQGRLMGWARRSAEEDVFVRTHLAGALPDPGRGDVFTYSFVNAAGNKIDAYSEGTASYDVHVDQASGVVRATATLVVRNAAPTGLPDAVIGNLEGLPFGNNRTLITVYSALTPTTMTIGDQQVDFVGIDDGAYHGADKFVDIPQGQSVKVTVQFQGTLDLAAGYHVVLRSPAMANDFPLTLTVNGTQVANLDKAGTKTFTVPRT